MRAIYLLMVGAGWMSSRAVSGQVDEDRRSWEAHIRGVALMKGLLVAATSALCLIALGLGHGSDITAASVASFSAWLRSDTYDEEHRQVVHQSPPDLLKAFRPWLGHS